MTRKKESNEYSETEIYISCKKGIRKNSGSRGKLSGIVFYETLVSSRRVLVKRTRRSAPKQAQITGKQMIHSNIEAAERMTFVLCVLIPCDGYIYVHA